MSIKNKRLRCSLFFFSLLFALCAQGQVSFNDSIAKEYPFLCLDYNRVENDSAGLARFYAKLSALQSKKVPRVSIVHIGDSHIQADFFSGKVRQELQLQFGNAGRGLVIPYRVARTNEPNSYQTSTNVTWQARRNVIPNDTIPIGLSGVTIKTLDTSAILRIRVLNQPGLDYSFNKLTLFHEKGQNTFDFVVCDELNCVINSIHSSNLSSSPFASIQYFDKPMTELYFKNQQHDTLQKFAQVYGILLENGQPGILYNTIGVNGAEYRHYSASQYFNEQLGYLQPDLLVISMGTNEAYSAKFNPEVFYKQVDSLVTSLKRAHPDADFLFTTPGDSYRKRKVKNPSVRLARNVIQDYCYRNGMAYWDLYYVMGGYGSILQWFKRGLTAKDKLHFSKKGYELQGELLYKAISDGYLLYQQHQH